MNAGTGVIRAFRGRGLGLLMKQHSLSLAAAAGITKVITQNDETNAPMLAINAKLGYAAACGRARLGARALSVAHSLPPLAFSGTCSTISRPNPSRPVMLPFG